MTDWAEEYRLAGEDWVDKEAAASILEETRTAYRAQKQVELGDIPVSRAEQAVLASAGWSQFVTDMVEARRVANLSKVHLKVVEMRYFKEQNANANARTEMKMLG